VLGLQVGATGRGARLAAARLHAARSGSEAVAVALAVRAVGELAAALHEEQALAATTVVGRQHPAVAAAVAVTGDRRLTRRDAAAILVPATRRSGGGECRASDARQDWGRPGDGGAGPDPLEHLPSGDALCCLIAHWIHEITPSLDPEGPRLSSKEKRAPCQDSDA